MENRFPLTGIVTYIGEVRAISQYFTKREFKIRFSDIDITNKATERIIKIDTINTNINLLDNIRIDDVVNVQFYIEGRDFIKEGKIVNFTSLVCYEIEIVSSPTRDTKEDYQAKITPEGKEYKTVLKPATDEELAGYMVEPDPLVKVPEGKSVIKEEDPFANIVPATEYKDLPF